MIRRASRTPRSRSGRRAATGSRTAQAVLTLAVAATMAACTPTARALIGSQNASPTSLRRNRELSVILPSAAATAIATEQAAFSTDDNDGAGVFEVMIPVESPIPGGPTVVHTWATPAVVSTTVTGKVVAPGSAQRG